MQHDLMGFIPGIQGCFNIVKLIDIYKSILLEKDQINFSYVTKII